MAYEIYYTSATEGLKRGAQGFCTVAATEGIPAALLQRLEALSGYRHHVAPGSAGAAQNPVTHAHWTLSLTGKTWHVLSRIKDAGFDYTHRTNSLAHHLALEAAELPPGGPAWLLAQPGVMLENWDGKVGPIARPAALPRDDAAATRCAAWERLTGDAGWGGVLAEALTKSASRPVCLLFAPGQDLLELMDEAIRLLPPALRWQATFNTYFTSMPTSVNCAWRCCLAGTPAAQAAIRYAANGLLLNLAEPQTLGVPPAGTWVTMARTGVATSATARLGGAKIPVAGPPRSKPAATAEVEFEAPPPEPSALDELATFNRTYPTAPQAAPPLRVEKPAPRKTRTEPSAQPPEFDALAQRNRRQMLLLYSAAVLVIGVATWTVFHATRTVDIPTPPPPPPRPVVATTVPVATQPVAPVPPPVVTPPIVEIHPPVPTPPPVVAPVVVVPPPPVVIAPEHPIVLREPLERAASGNGLRDKTQSIALAPAEIMRLRKVHSLLLEFPRTPNSYPYRQGDISGAFLVALKAGTDPAFFVEWKDAGTTGAAVDVLTVQLDRNRGQVDVTWKSSFLLRRPEVSALAFWIVQGSTLVAHEPGKATPHHLVFGPPDMQVIDLLDSTTPLHFACDLPPGCVLAARPGQMPAGWTVKMLDAKEPGAQALVLEKPTHVDSLPARFHLTLRPGATAVECDFAKQAREYTDGMDAFGKDLAKLDEGLKRLTADADTDVAELKKDLDIKVAWQSHTDADLRDHNFNRTGLNNMVDDLKRQIQNRTAKLEADKAPVVAKRTNIEQLYNGYREADAALAELKAFDLAVTLPDGQPITALHWAHK